MTIYAVPNGRMVAMEYILKEVHPFMVSFCECTVKDGTAELRLYRERVRFIKSYSKRPDFKWFCDSGAYSVIHTYVTTGVKPAVKQVEETIVDYLDLVADLPKFPSKLAEFDLQDIYGYSKIMEWREKYFIPFQRETGIKVVFVNHNERQKECNEWFLKSSDVQCVGTSLSGAGGIPLTFEDMRILQQKGKQIHGFASVNVKLLKVYPFNSVDSLGWEEASIYGNTKVWDSLLGKMKRGPRVGYRQTLDALLDFFKETKIWYPFHRKRKEQTKKVIEFELLQLKKMQEWLTAYWKIRGIDTSDD